MSMAYLQQADHLSYLERQPAHARHKLCLELAQADAQADALAKAKADAAAMPHRRDASSVMERVRATSRP